MSRWIALSLAIGCSGGSDGSDGEDSAVAAPTLSEVQEQVFGPSCGFGVCHGSPGSNDLTLDDIATTWDELVDVPAFGAPGEILVVPGDSEGSYLVAKLRGDDGIVGDPMPVGAPLEADRLQLVIDWIDAGAAAD